MVIWSTARQSAIRANLQQQQQQHQQHQFKSIGVVNIVTHACPNLSTENVLMSLDRRTHFAQLHIPKLCCDGRPGAHGALPRRQGTETFSSAHDALQSNEVVG